jgi:hypothetical protein
VLALIFGSRLLLRWQFESRGRWLVRVEVIVQLGVVVLQ